MLASNLSPVVIERDVCDSLKCLLSFAAHFREDESALSVAQSLALSVQQPALAKRLENSIPVASVSGSGLPLSRKLLCYSHSR